MKKIVMAVCLTVGFCKCVVWAGQDRFGSMRPAVWRSSRTATADTNVSIASTSIFFHGVVIGSPTTSNSGGSILIFDATTFTLPGLTTAVFMTTDDTNPKVYDIAFSTGFLYRKTGTGDVNFLWDYAIKNPTGRP